MSFEVTTLVWRAEFPAMDKIVLLRLADFADADGRNVYPSVGRVARECGVSERHVQGVLRKLTAADIITLVRAGGGRNRPAEYRIDLAAVKRCIPCGVSDEKPRTACGELPLENPAPGAPIISKTPQATTETPQITTENPAPGAPNPSESTRNHQAAAAATHATSGAVPNCETSDQPSGGAVPHNPGAVRDAHAVGRKVLDLMGATNDPRWYGDSSRVEMWLRSGADPEADIYPTIIRLMRGLKGKLPNTLKYFDKAIGEAMLDRTATLTIGDDHGNPTRHQGRSRSTGHSAHEALFAGGAAVAAQFRKEGGDRG